VISLINVREGVLRKGIWFLYSCSPDIYYFHAGDKIVSCHTRKRYEVTELGIMYPEEVPTSSLRPGHVGYIACNMKESSEGIHQTALSGALIYQAW